MRSSVIMVDKVDKAHAVTVIIQRLRNGVVLNTLLHDSDLV